MRVEAHREREREREKRCASQAAGHRKLQNAAITAKESEWKEEEESSNPY
jgi:hypothetical protein